jgi:peptidoglycan/LPS O-acetylase OafA/YrhL
MIERNYVLDGMRGVCAIAVMLVHLSQFNGLTWFKNAGGAVDAFFIISGYVIAQNYQNRINNTSCGFVVFFKTRFKRLAPINAISALFGFAAIILIIIKNNQNIDLGLNDLIESLVLSILFIPNFNNFSWPYGNAIQIEGLFPLNIPAWSLFLEWVAFFVFFLTIRYLIKYVRLIWFLFFVIYFFTCFTYQMDNPGWSQSSIWQGVARVLFGFFTGVTIYQIKKDSLNKNYLLAIVFMMISFFLLLYGNVTFSLLNTFIFMPGTIYFISNLKCPPSIEKIFFWMGEISFPVYLIHIPIVTFLLVLIPQFRSLSPYLQIFILSFIIIVFSHLLNIVDKKIRLKY